MTVTASFDSDRDLESAYKLESRNNSDNVLSGNALNSNVTLTGKITLIVTVNSTVTRYQQ